MSLSPACSTAHCFDSEAYRAQQDYRRELDTMESQVQGSENQYTRRRREEAAARQHALWHERLRRRCESERMTDCNNDLTLRRLEDLDRPYGRQHSRIPGTQLR